MYYRPPRPIDESYRQPKNKISEFIQSEYVKDLFPEYNPSHPSPPTYDLPKLNHQNNGKEYFYIKSHSKLFPDTPNNFLINYKLRLRLALLYMKYIK